MSEEKRRLLRPYEWVLLGFALLLMAHFGLQALGVNMTSKGSEMAWLEQPTGPAKIYSPSPDRSRKREVNKTLDQLAVQFAEGKSFRAKPQDLQPKGLNKDEAKYYSDLRQRKNDNRLSAKDWAEIMKSSYNTYKSVRSIFDQVDGSQDEKVDESELGQILSDIEMTNRVFSRIEQDFGVPRAQLEAFATRGSRALCDWATFVDQNRR